MTLHRLARRVTSLLPLTRVAAVRRIGLPEGRLGTALALAGILGFAIWLCWPVIADPGLPWGGDTNGHLARVEYMAQSFRDTGSLPHWFPHWYVGTSLVQYYPPLATLAMLPIQLLTDDITTTYRIFVVLCIALAGAITFLAVRRWASPLWAALAALLFIGSPFNVWMTFSEGSLARTLQLVFLPLILYLTMRLLDGGSRRVFFALAATTFVAMLVHHQQVALTMIALGAVGLVYLLRTPREARWNVLLVFGAWGLGIALAAWWLIPALTHSDYATVPGFSLLPARLSAFSIDWSNLGFAARDLDVAKKYVGTTLLIVAALTVVLRPTRRNVAFVLGAGVCIFFAFGANNPAYEHIPTPGFFPERFLNFGILLMAVTVSDLGVALKGRRVYRAVQAVVLAAVVAVTVADSLPYWGLPRLFDYPGVHSALETLPRGDGYGRLEVRSGDDNSIWAALPVTEAEYRLAGGWSIETTPHLLTFLENNRAVRDGYPEFVRRNYGLWNVRAAVVGQNELALVDELDGAGFQVYQRDAPKILLASDEPSKPVMEFKTNAIAIGRGRFPTVTALPWFGYATSDVLDDLDMKYLDLFDSIYLYDFRYENWQDIQSSIRQWTAAGKTVVLDLTLMPNPELFGVTPHSIELPLNPEFIVSPQVGFAAGGVASEPFGREGNPWRGVVYEGLDGVLVEVRDVDGRSWPVLGYEEIADGRVYFLGLNLISHILDTHDQTTRTFFEGFFGQAGAYREMELPAFPLTDVSPSSDHWGFSYETESPAKALVSETWSRHWRAAVDGEPLRVHNHENLMVLELPAGVHTVTFDYGRTPIQWVGWAATGLAALLGLVVWVYYERIKGWYASAEEELKRQLTPPARHRPSK